jgi:hypothetical protein
MCEDFEAITLYEDVGFGDGAPDFGPWYDESGSGFTCFRGNNQYWRKTYAVGVSGMLWAEGDPATPTVGCTCDTGGAGKCNTGAWHPSDLWQANSFANLAILRDGDFNDEVADLGSGTSNNSDGGSGVFDGVQVYAHKIRPGGNHGIVGNEPFAASTTWGITQAVAYAANLDDSGILNHPWKTDEWLVVRNSKLDGLLAGHVSTSSINPFQQNTVRQFSTEAECDTAIGNATISAGTMSCDSVAMRWFADAGIYSRDTDYPLGTWGCQRAYWENTDTGSTTMKIWFVGPAGDELLIFDVSGLDLTGTRLRDGVDGFSWNAYANANQGPPEVATTEITYRYHDNVHITAGLPVACSQIGFGDPAPSPVEAMHRSRRMVSLIAISFVALVVGGIVILQGRRRSSSTTLVGKPL